MVEEIHGHKSVVKDPDHNIPASWTDVDVVYRCEDCHTVVPVGDKDRFKETDCGQYQEIRDSL